MDGNRTRRRRITTTTRFEGGGAHQVPGHLRRAPYRRRGYRGGMKKLLILAILVALGFAAAKKLRVD